MTAVDRSESAGQPTGLVEKVGYLFDGSDRAAPVPVGCPCDSNFRVVVAVVVAVVVVVVE